VVRRPVAPAPGRDPEAVPTSNEEPPSLVTERPVWNVNDQPSVALIRQLRGKDSCAFGSRGGEQGGDGRVRRRLNRYESDLTPSPTGSAWKTPGFEVRDQERPSP
jgi:hypothetical protein